MTVASLITFDARSHVYRLSGRRIYSVTQVLKGSGRAKDFVALRALVSPAKRARIDAKCELGVLVHAYAHEYDDGRLDWTTVRADAVPYLHAWASFRTNTKVLPFARERLVYDDIEDYVGTLDAVFQRGRRNILIDIKLGDPAAAACDLQTAAYAAAWNRLHPDMPIHERWGVYLNPERTVPYVVFPYTDWHDYERWRRALYDFRHGGGMTGKVTPKLEQIELDIEEVKPAPLDVVNVDPDDDEDEDGADDPDWDEDREGDDADGPIDEPTEELTPVSAVVPLMSVLPADFPLPVLTRFVPNQALKVKVDEATTYAKSIEIKGLDGLERADRALTVLREAIKAVERDFAEPAEVAFQLHRAITGRRREWLQEAAAVAEQIGKRVYDERVRLDREAEERRRAEQEAADQQERDRLRKEAEDAEKAGAPASIVEELREQASTAMAAPVPAAPASTASVLRGTSTVTTWKARLIGTPADAEPNPSVSLMTPAQLEQFKVFLRAVLDGDPGAPISALDLRWSVLNVRAMSDKTTMRIPGFEAFKVGSSRGKPGKRI